MTIQGNSKSVLFYSDKPEVTVYNFKSPLRPKNILVILSGRKPYQKVNMIINKRTVLSMDQLITDISKGMHYTLYRQGNDYIYIV